MSDRDQRCDYFLDDGWGLCELPAGHEGAHARVKERDQPRWTVDEDGICFGDTCLSFSQFQPYTTRKAAFDALVAAVRDAAEVPALREQLEVVENDRDNLRARLGEVLARLEAAETTLARAQEAVREILPSEELWDRFEAAEAVIEAHDAVEHLIADHTDDRDAYNAAVTAADEARRRYEAVRSGGVAPTSSDLHINGVNADAAERLAAAEAEAIARARGETP